MGMKSLHRNLLQGVCLWSLLAVQVSSCPDSCSLCSGPENDQCEECRDGWTLHNKICVGTVYRASFWSQDIITFILNLKKKKEGVFTFLNVVF